MTFNTLTKSLPKPLRQPANLATLISVGFHGLLFAGLAAVPLVSPPNDLEVVNLVTLTPEEQQQLAQIPNSSQAIPGMPLPMPNSSMALPPDLQGYLPAPGSFNSSFLPPLGVPDMPLPAPPPIYFPPMQDFIPAPLSPLPNVPVPDSALPPGWQFRPGRPGPTQPNPQPEKPLALNPPPRVGAPPPGDVPQATNPPTTDTGSPTTDPLTAINNMRAWAALFPGASRTEETPFQFNQTLEFTYPKEACAGKLTGRASVAAMIGPDGQLLQATNGSPNPRLLVPSGSSILDQAAIATVQNAKLPTGSRQIKVYQFNIDGEQAAKACAAAPSPSPGESPAASPSPGSSPDAKASPSPGSSPNATESPKPEPAKPEAAKPEPPKPEAPKPSPSATAEPPKPEAAKPEPKPEATKPEAPPPSEPAPASPPPEPAPAAP